MQLQNSLFYFYIYEEEKNTFITRGYVSLLFFDQSQARETTCKQKEITTLCTSSIIIIIIIFDKTCIKGILSCGTTINLLLELKRELNAF